MAAHYKDGNKADAVALGGAIASRRISARKAMQAAIAMAEANTHLGALAVFDPELGLAQAEAMDAAMAADPIGFRTRPFAGLPTLAKDLGGPFKGIPLRLGSERFRDKTKSDADSDLAERFRAAGFCLFGSTSAPEFGLSLSTEPLGMPPCRNPLATDRIAGGSSGGAAAAVASGIVAIAHATDAGGSIRVPAACCGLIGLKPSRGAMPGGPGFANNLGGVASEFVIARSIRDAGVAFNQLAGQPKGPYPEPHFAEANQGRYRIGVLEDFGNAFALDDTRGATIAEAARALQDSGHSIEVLGWGEIEEAALASSMTFKAIIAANLASLFEGDVALNRLEPMTKAAIAYGRGLSGATLWRAMEKIATVSHALWRLFDRFDLILAPMLSSAPPLLGHFPTDHDDYEGHIAKMSAFAPLATLANVAGAPALTLPFGQDEDGLPVPLQIFAPMGCEALLIAIGSQLEAQGRWSHTFPIAGLPQ
ncbi:amidase [Pelagibacterium lentulum]|uniref:amidase n=1 Tax=Pelagibacterium lentulum TaxID=2029865 RepID=UPI000F8EBFE2|nr:amidase [Pelagibacterium lentulum]